MGVVFTGPVYKIAGLSAVHSTESLTIYYAVTLQKSRSSLITIKYNLLIAVANANIVELEYVLVSCVVVYKGIVSITCLCKCRYRRVF